MRDACIRGWQRPWCSVSVLLWYLPPTPQVALSLGVSQGISRSTFHSFRPLRFPFPLGCPKGFPEAPSTASGPKVFLPCAWVQTLQDRGSRHQPFLFITFLSLSSSLCMCPGPQDWGRMKEWSTMSIFHWCYFFYIFGWILSFGPVLHDWWCLPSLIHPKEMTLV